MDQALKRKLIGTLFRFRGIGLSSPPGLQVTMSEFIVMRQLADCTAQGGQSDLLGELQHRLSVSKPAISQIFNSLQKKGFILREIDSKDRRKIRVTLTPSGDDILQAVAARADVMLEAIVARFGEDNMQDLVHLLNRFADVFEEMKKDATLNDASCAEITLPQMDGFEREDEEQGRCGL